MSVGLVHYPRPAQRERSHDPESVAVAPIGNLAGKTIGIRIDESWRSWNWIADDWARRLETAGAEIVMWRASKRQGARGREVQQELEDFISKVDFAIVGICNCGGCTMQTVSDTMAALDAGVPAITISTEHFKTLARNLATGAGWPDLRIKTVPFPLETLPEAEIHKIADEHYDNLLDVIGADR